MITHFNHDNHAKNLPDAYCKTAGSNNDKILRLEKETMDSLRAAVNAVCESLDLDKAFGKTLDLYGDMIGQERGSATDEQYRVLLRSRIVRNLSDGDHSSIVRAISAAFGCEPSDVKLTEHETCAVTLDGLPISWLNEQNIDIITAVQIVNSLIPVGVRMETMEFSGTFEFGGTELEYDENAGFGNIEQTVGGYFGLVSDNRGSNLPV